MKMNETSIYELIDRVNISPLEKVAIKEQVRKIELIGDFFAFLSDSIGGGLRALRLKLQPAKPPVEFEG